MEVDTQTTIILGCPFLAMASAMIDVKNERLFHLLQAMASSSLEDTCYWVDVLKWVLFEVIGTLSPP